MKNVLFALLIFASVLFAQQEPERHISAKIGLGTIKSNSPEITSLSLGLAYASTFGFLPVPLKFEYQLHKKIEYFFPGEYYEQTYPYLQTLSVSAVIFENISPHWFLDFDLGLVLIHDRVFDNADTFSQGVSVDISAGYHGDNWLYYVGIDYGLGVTQHNPTYTNYFFSLKYAF